MNKVFKVIWSEARNAYVVVSEMAKSHGTKSCSTKKLLAMLIATGVMTCASMAPAMAAQNVDASATVNVGKKAVVAVEEQAKVNVKKNAKVNVEEGAELTVKNGAKVTFSKDAGVGFDNGAKVKLGNQAGVNLADGATLSVAQGSNVSVAENVTIGKGAVSSPYVGQTGNVAIGEKALAWNGNGLQEALMDFGQGGAKVKSFWGIPYGAEIVDGTKLPGSIAIGKNTVARSGSTMIGDHGYTGKIGDITITPDGNGIMKYNNDVYSTTIGANSFNSGALASVTGVFSIASSKYDGANNKFHAVQNTGATIYGSMNSIESATSDAEYSGIASSVLGFANRTQNANAALIWGTGNEVTNSIENIGIDYNGWNKISVAEAQQKAIEAMQSSDYAGGSVMAIGGGNKADYATYSELTGVQNKVTGTKAKAAKYDFVNGYQNTVTEASDVTVIGSKNEVTADGNKVIGDNHKVSGKDNVIFGSADQLTETTVNNAVVLGHNAKVTGEGGVALGAGSVADRANAVSVGSKGAERQIINVAAGTADTDAVNVSQLKKVSDTANAGWNLSTNGVGTKATNVKPGEYVDFSGDKNISVSHDGTKVQVELNKNIDVNSIKTNALNSKYNLSVGTMAENGIMPFLVSSTGAFYAANNNFSVDKDGKVIATAGKIGNVVLKNGVYTGNSALRDGELYLGDASGNYSQITPKSAKLGQVTIDEKGNMAGVNSIQTNALNAKYNLSVGTMAENGIMPFLVSSTGAFYAANNNFSVDKDGKVIATAGKIGNVVLQNGVYTGNSALRDGELYVGDASGNYSQITTTGAKLGQVTIAADGKISGVAAGEADTDAVNVSQLKEAVEAGNTDTHIKPGEYGVGADNTVNMDVVDKNGNKVDTVTIKDVAKASDVGNVNNIADDIKNGEGHTTVVDAVNNLNQKLDNKVGDLNYVEGGKGNYVTNGENTTTSIGKLDQALKDVADTANQGWNLSTNGGEASKVAPGKTVDFSGDKNIIISNDGTNVNVKLNEAIDVDTVKANTVTAKTVTTGNTVMNSDGVKVGADVSLNQNGLNVGKDVSVTATAVTAGKTSISDEGVKVGDKTYISADGLNANGQHITNVKAGEADTDAVNYGQLKDTNNRINGVENQVISNSNRINQLGNRVNKVGAGAAALAALHPMDFDPDDKLTFSAGYGNYGGENAAAIGAYYRPDEKVMFSVAGTVGNGENMVNAGVSFALDRTNHVSNSRTALAREVIDLRGQLAVMGAKMAKMEKAFGMLDETKTKLFPDVPANHWAYEYIAKLAGNGYIEGYPDGNFGGDRLMTRYEFAAMLYRAIEKGAALEEKIIKEFEPELGRIRVDRISGEDGDRDKIERVRVNDTKGERDHYGNKLAK